MSLKLRTVHFDGKEIQFTASHIDTPESYVTVLVGKNGAGKSRLLSAMVQGFLRAYQGTALHANSKPAKFLLKYSIHGRELEVSDSGFPQGSNPQIDDLPTRVIATSMSPFDKFPIQQNGPGARNTRYAYMGCKPATPYAPHQIGKIASPILRAATKGPENWTRLSDVLGFLGFKPKITLLYHPMGSLDEIAKGGVQSIYTKITQPHIGYPPPLQPSTSDIEELRGAAIDILALQRSSNGKISLALNFERGDFPAEIEKLAKALALLSRYRIVQLMDCMLYKFGTIEVRLRQASSGEQATILTLLGIAGEIEPNSLICIDEPELSLHPEWQERFINLLVKTFKDFTGCHFILATHSPQVIAQLETENCAIVSLDENITYPSSDFAGRSADFQLARLFKSPGRQNEFLLRSIALVISRLGSSTEVDDQLHREIQWLRLIRPQISAGEVAAELIDGILLAIERR